MLLLTRTALAQGLRAGWLMVLGITTGLTVHATVAIGGMAVVLSQGGWLARGLEFAAAGYLLWLAWGLLQKGEPSIEVEASRRSPYLRGLFCNLLNPKALIFFASIVASFLAGDRPTWWPLALWSVLVIEALGLWTLWVWLLQNAKIRSAYQRASRIVDLLFAVALTALALHLIW